jgi:hypothetical protein
MGLAAYPLALRSIRLIRRMESPLASFKKEAVEQKVPDR